MQKRRLGSLDVSCIGLGCMSMTPIYGDPDPEEAINTVHRALDLGVTLIDTSDAYGFGANEELLAKALKGSFRDRAVLATKFGNIRRPDGSTDVNGRPEYVMEACDKSLKRLGTDRIDLYYVHRIDTNVPIEDTVGAMTRLKEQGKIAHIALSEASASTLRRAHAVHPIAALQTEYSLWSRDVEGEILDACTDLGVGFVAYSPLGRGFLTGTITGDQDLGPKDRRRDMPRFQGENFAENLKLLDTLRDVAKAEHATPAQIAIAWLLTRKPWVVPLPGSKQRKWVEQNVEATQLSLAPETLTRLDEAFVPGRAKGTRYPAAQMKRLAV